MRLAALVMSPWPVAHDNCSRITWGQILCTTASLSLSSDRGQGRVERQSRAAERAGQKKEPGRPGVPRTSTRQGSISISASTASVSAARTTDALTLRGRPWIHSLIGGSELRRLPGGLQHGGLQHCGLQHASDVRPVPTDRGGGLEHSRSALPRTSHRHGPQHPGQALRALHPHSPSSLPRASRHVRTRKSAPAHLNLTEQASSIAGCVCLRPSNLLLLDIKRPWPPQRFSGLLRPVTTITTCLLPSHLTSRDPLRPLQRCFPCLDCSAPDQSIPPGPP